MSELSLNPTEMSDWLPQTQAELVTQSPLEKIRGKIDELKEELTSHKMALRRAIATGLVASAGFLTACGSEDIPQTTTWEVPTITPTAQVENYDTQHQITIEDISDTETLNISANTETVETIAAPTHEPLSPTELMISEALQGLNLVETLAFTESYVPENLVDASLLIQGNVEFWQGTENHLIDERAVPYLQNFVNAANAAGYNLQIAHTYRSYQEQSDVYEANPLGAALPGASQHQTGLAFDLYVGPNYQIIDQTLIDLAAQNGILHPFSMEHDPPHFIVVDAIAPGLAKSIAEGKQDQLAVINTILQKEYETQ